MIDINNLKDKFEELLEEKSGKLIAAKKIGKRNEYIFSIGKTNYSPSEKIYEDDLYVFFAEGIEEQLKEKLKNFLK